ncbi:MAG: hypothetical protein WCO56_24290 [Verrucomicrobiota bacterium]
MKTNNLLLRGATLAALLPGLLASLAGDYTIDTYTISGGGGGSTNGNYALIGTLGQLSSGAMSGGSYSLAGGFWSQAGIIQTPGSPQLSLKRESQSYIFSWPEASARFALEQNGNLAVTNGWTGVSQGLATNNGIISVTVPVEAGYRFYRLKQF